MDAAPRGQQRYVSSERRLNGFHGPKNQDANSGQGRAKAGYFKLKWKDDDAAVGSAEGQVPKPIKYQHKKRNNHNPDDQDCH